MAVLVVGGAGYIGSHAAHTLQRRGYEVIIYDNLCTGHKELTAGFELIVGDIADSAKLTKALNRCDAVMHFAAHAYVGESLENPKKYFQNNVTAALTLLDAVMNSRVRKFIFCPNYAHAASTAELLYARVDHAAPEAVLESLMEVAHLPQLFFDPAVFNTSLKLS